MATNTPPNNPAASRVRWRRQLLTENDATAQRLTESYQRLIPNLQDSITLLEGRLQQIAEAGGDITAARVRGLSEYQNLLDRVQREMQSFAAITRDQAGAGQQLALGLGADAAQDMVMAQAGGAGQILLGVWNQPDPAALARLVNYVDSPAMQERFAQFGANAAANMADVLLAGVAQGKNPRAIAGLLNTWFAVPLAWAENMTRTAALWSYRSASIEAYRANADVVSGWMWWAALDARTCLCCISQHGSVHGLDETLNGHHRCRCTPLPIVKGTTWANEVVTGPDWFATLGTAMQQQIMNPSMYQAWVDGAVGWGDFVHPYQNDVYGEMLRESSLKEILGDGATDYY
jgi:hypothetical protein